MALRSHIALAIVIAVLLVSLVTANLRMTEDGKEDSLSLYWDAMDANGDGHVTIPEMESLFTKLYGHGVSIGQLKKLVEKLDRNQDSQISLREFLDRYGASFSPLSPVVPQQLHLALTGVKSEMRVTWVTRSPVNQPYVKFGTSASFGQVAYATTSTYMVGTFVPWVGWIHTAVMKGLAPATQYSYSVGAAGAPSSKIKTFKTESASPSVATIALYGDMGTIMPFGFQVAFQIDSDNQASPYDLVVHAGDIAYGGTGRTYEFEFIWDLFGRQIEPYASEVPYMTAVGNHEHYFNFSSYSARFQMPSAQSGGNGNFWLSFDHSFAHWVFMSTEHDYTPGSVQYSWLVQDLKKAVANRANVPWIFLVGHRPMYCSDASEYGSYSPGGFLSTHIEPLLLQYNVDMYWSGHQHMYERTWPHINGTNILTFPDNRYVVPKRPAYVVQGSAGAFIGEEWIQPRPAWSAFREQQYGYGRLTLSQTSFHYEFISADTDSVRDEFWLIREAN
jgi:hypothetical protein